MVQNSNGSNERRGARIFKTKCSQCHTIHEGGAHKQGPNLHGFYGKKAGTTESFGYSDATRKAGVTWDDDNLMKWLENPKKFIKYSRMVFPGLKEPQDRADVVAYLKRVCTAEP